MLWGEGVMLWVYGYCYQVSCHTNMRGDRTGSIREQKSGKETDTPSTTYISDYSLSNLLTYETQLLIINSRASFSLDLLIE